MREAKKIRTHDTADGRHFSIASAPMGEIEHTGGELFDAAADLSPQNAAAPGHGLIFDRPIRRESIIYHH